MAVVISATTQAVGRLPAPVAVAVGVAALIVVMLPGSWSLLNHFGRLAHEGAHAVVGSCLGGRVVGVHLNWKERNGHTDVLTTGGGDFTTTVVGYFGPSGFGLAAAGLIAHGQIVPVLWIGVALLAILLLSMRGVFGITLVIGVGWLLLSIARSKNAALEAVTAYWLSWLLLISGIRGVRDRRDTGSGDGKTMREITGLPQGLWYLFWLAGSVAALAWGATMLV